MYKLLSYGEKVIAVSGALLCLVAGVMRLAGVYHIAHVESITLFIVGVGAMTAAILMKLHLQS